MAKYYVSIPSVEKFVIEKESQQEVLDYMFENYNLKGYEDEKKSDNVLFFTTTYENNSYKTQCSISLEEGIDLDGWNESMEELYERKNVILTIKKVNLIG